MGCCQSNVSRDTKPAPEESKPNDAITTFLPDNTVANAKETADNISQKDLSPDQIIMFVEAALEIYLPDYEFYHIGIGGIRTTRPNPPEKKYVMEVARDSNISLAPDLTGTKLSYGLLPTTYTLYAGFKKPNFVKFVYQWTQGGQTFLTSPYSLDSTQVGDTVPCADPIDITDALWTSDPIAAIILELEHLHSVSSPPIGTNHNLKGTDFRWTYGGNFGVQMCINSSSGLFWEDVNGTIGEVKLTNSPARKLWVKLVDIS